MERFKRRFKNINVRRKRISEEFTNSLLLDPCKNIPLGTWYSEEELREKADIHRTARCLEQSPRCRLLGLLSQRK